MKILTPENTIVDINRIGNRLSKPLFYSVLSFADSQNPDFFFRELNAIEEFNSPAITITIGEFNIVMPLNWSILCADMEYVQSIPLYEISAREYNIFSLNPICGYKPGYPTLRMGEIFPNTSWSTPPISDKDMLVVPLGNVNNQVDTELKCAMFSSSKIEVSRPISDIF